MTVDVNEAPLESPRLPVSAHAGQRTLPNTPAGRNWDFNTDSEVLRIEIIRN